MSARGLHWLAGAMVASVLFLGPTVAEGQISAEAIRAEADRLHDISMSFDTGKPVDIGRITDLHGEAARLRLVDDPRAVECMRFQAMLLHLDGRMEEAQAQFELAAAIAQSRGDHLAAGLLYVDAAFIAEAAGRPADTSRLAQAAYQVSDAGALDPGSRALVRDRLPAGIANR